MYIIKKVIYDAHENLSLQVFGKYYLSLFSKYILKILVNVFESICYRFLDGIIAATPSIKNYYKKFNHNIINIKNYPLSQEFSSVYLAKGKKKYRVYYVGGISNNRGLSVILKAIEYLKSPVQIILIGSVENQEDENLILKNKNFNKILFLFNNLSRKKLISKIKYGLAGLSVLKPTPNHLEALPIKLFEYMASGIPYVASGSKQIIKKLKKYDCGYAVDFNSPRSLAKVIDYVYNHQAEAKKKGKNGKKFFDLKFNWNREEKKLLCFYKEIMSN